MKGFTLIETIVYMALLGLIMTGALLSAFDLIGSTQSSAGNTTAQEEGAFVERKLEWALADMSSAPTVGGSGCAQTLSVNKTGYANNPIEFQRNSASNTIEIREGGSGAYTALTTNNVSATCLTFTALAAAGNAPPGVTAVTTLNGFEFVTTYYVHK